MTASNRLDMRLGDAIFTLRAIRRQKPDPIPDQDLREILEAGIHAPNGGNAQNWHFLVLKDPDIRTKFAALYKEAWWAKRKDEGVNGPEDLPPGNNPRQWARRFSEEIGSSPVLLLACCTVKGDNARGSVIPAVQNMLLAARSLGIGGTITTLHPQVNDRVHQLLNIPDTAQIVYCIPLGYPRGNFGPTSRNPLSEVCSFDRWGSPMPGI